jgi:ribonuclease Y
MSPILSAILAGVVGIVIGIVIMKMASSAGLDRAKLQAQTILDESNAKAENIVRQAELDGKQQVYEMKERAERELKGQRNKIQQTENKLLRREDSLNFREENLNSKEKKLEQKTKTVEDELANIDKMQAEL